MSRILCRSDDIPDAGAIAVEVPSSTGGFSVILVRLGADVFAYHNECPHQGRRLDWAPGRFLMEAGMLVCAAHGAAFALESGYCLGGPCRGQSLHRVPIVVEEGQVRLAADRE